MDLGTWAAITTNIPQLGKETRLLESGKEGGRKGRVASLVAVRERGEREIKNDIPEGKSTATIFIYHF